MDNYIVYIGRPCYQKNTLFLIDVIAKVHEVYPKVRFMLLGVGFYSPELDEVKSKIVKLQLEDTLELKPWLDHTEALKYVKESLFYLTVSRYEGLPLSVIEAMSLRKAIVASDVVGNKDCVRDGYNGWLLQLNIHDFSNAIYRLIEDRSLRDKFGMNSRLMFEEKFLIENRIKYLEDIYMGKTLNSGDVKNSSCENLPMGGGIYRIVPMLAEASHEERRWAA